MKTGEPAADSLPTVPATPVRVRPSFPFSLDPDGRPFDAQALLAAHPEWANDKFLALDLAYEEFCRRRETGEPVEVVSFCARFPHYRSSLQRLLAAHDFLEESRDFLSGRVQARWPQPGEAFLGYVLVRQLGRGAFARVFLATEPALGGRQVALKISQFGSDEALTLGKLSHPNIVAVHSTQTDAVTGFTAICMPYLGRATLCDVLDQVSSDSLPESTRILDTVLDPGTKSRFHGTYVDAVLRMGVQLAEALAFVHEQGILHRDLKPSNVLLADDGRPMLLDFNLSLDRQIADHRLGGTLPYMPPEQLRATDPNGNGDPTLVDARSDIFSLGLILYELLAGRHPFGPLPPKKTTSQMRSYLLERHHQLITPLAQVNPRVDRGVSRLVERCLTSNPVERPQTATHLAADLRRALSWRRRAARWVSRRRRAVATTIGVALVIGGVTVYALAQRPSFSARELRAGQEIYRAGDFKGAIARYTNALDEVPDSAAALFARGRAHQQLGALESALADFKAAANLADDGPTHACIGFCHARLGRPYFGAQHFSLAIEKGYAPVEVWTDLGYCQHLNAKLDDAKVALDRAMELNPEYRPALHARALVALQVALSYPGRGTGRGVADIRKALALGPATTDMLRLAAWLHAEAGDKTSALNYLKLAIESGQDPLPLMKDTPFRTMRDDTDFQELLRTVKPKSEPSKSTRLVDPVLDTSR